MSATIQFKKRVVSPTILIHKCVVKTHTKSKLNVNSFNPYNPYFPYPACQTSAA